MRRKDGRQRSEGECAVVVYREELSLIPGVYQGLSLVNLRPDTTNEEEEGIKSGTNQVQGRVAKNTIKQTPTETTKGIHTEGKSISIIPTWV
jgi:hypothetical protein